MNSEDIPEIDERAELESLNERSRKLIKYLLALVLKDKLFLCVSQFEIRLFWFASGRVSTRFLVTADEEHRKFDFYARQSESLHSIVV